MWFVFWIGRGLLALVGHVVVRIAVKAKAYDKKQRILWTGDIVDQYYFTWRWLWLFDNNEEGCAWYVEDGADPNDIPARIIYSSCVRNPVNNMRYVPYLSLKIDPRRVRYIGRPVLHATSYDADNLDFWYLCWCGWYGNFRMHFEIKKRLWHRPFEMIISTFKRKQITIAGRYRLWAGHKIYPGDIFGVTDHRKISAGFGSQFKRLT